MTSKGKLPQTFQTIFDLVKRLVSLYIEDAKLTVAEKLSLLLSAGLMLIVVLVFGIFALAFFSGACVELLELVLPAWACYSILGGVFVIMIIICVLFRTALFVNPIARYISKLIFEKDKENFDKN